MSPERFAARRASRRPRGAALAAAVLGAFLLSIPAAGLPAGKAGETARQAEDNVMAADGPSIDVLEHSYQIEANPLSTVVTVESTTGVEYSSFPLLMVPGTGRLPAGVHRQLRLLHGRLVATLTSASGSLIERTVLTPGPDAFTVQFSAALPKDPPDGPAVFFCDGVRGLEAGVPAGVFVPDLSGMLDPAGPSVSAKGRRPFAPPPFQVQVRGRAGWLGVGLVQVPNATTMRLRPECGISIDYRLGLIQPSPGPVGGGGAGTMVTFPTFVLTFGADPYQALRSYYTALAGMGAVVTPDPATRPLWWQEPMADTWGQQRAEHVQRGSPRFTAGWVLKFAETWRARFGVSRFTLVIDSRWQTSIGNPVPDPVRFGGWAGMRRLVDRLHSQGIRVLLWWPLWIRYPFESPPDRQALSLLPARFYVDPTAAGFDAATRYLTGRLLGKGPDSVGANGLKLDWGYDLSPSVADPSQGWGAAALLRYMTILHQEAHRVRPDALIDSSAAAPQFQAVTDSVRLYDAWSEAQWAKRAAIVAAVDPGVLIDGDGWRAGPADIGPHTVASTVFGVPAVYYSDRWADGAPLPAGVAAALGRVVSLSTLKGGGTATITPGGNWRYFAHGTLTAESFDSNRALAVWVYAACRATGAVVSTVDSDLRVPLPGGGSRLIDARAGTGYTIRVPVSDCQGGRRGPPA